MRPSHLLSIVAVILSALPRPAAAQVWEVGNRRLEYSGTHDHLDRFGVAVATGDFDGDGYDDLAIGADLAGVSGVVEIYRGGADGLGAAPWTTVAPTIGAARFGAALAAGDFDGDGRDELAVGAPFYDNVVNLVTVTDSGRVFVLELVGDVWTATFAFSQAGPELDDSAEEGDRFGHTLAAGDLSNDGWDELVIGVPFEAIDGVVQAGALHVLYGTPNGLTTVGSQLWHRSGGGLNGVAAPSQLGAALAIGDFDSDGVGDLAIGAPYQEISEHQFTGEVLVVYGLDGFGLASAKQQAIDPTDLGEVAAGQEFGSALAAGDFNPSFACAILGSCADDLAIGAPDQDVFYSGQTRTDAGRVAVLRGNPNVPGLDVATAEWIDQATLSTVSQTFPESTDRFGAALAAGDLDGRGGADLLFGAPDEDLNGNANAGAMHLLLAGGSPLSAGTAQFFWTAPWLASASNTGDEAFGAALAIGDFDADGHGDLAIGIPSRDLAGAVDGGIVQILYGALFADGFERGSTLGWTLDAP